MQVRLEFGRSGLDINLTDEADIIQPNHASAVTDATAALVASLRSPIGCAPLLELVRPHHSVGIVVCDVTRPFPAARVLPVLLDELPSKRITVFVATGTHRKCTADELTSMFGPRVLERVNIIQHDAFDRNRHTRLGSVPGTDVPALVETAFLEQDVRITTGFIEPHFFAGFSGGPKMVNPGLAGLETVLELHSAARIGHPNARWGTIEGNPIHDPVREIASRAGVTFNLDVTLNRKHQITKVFAGELFQSHRAGCEFARRTAMVGVDQPYDVVVTSNGGYPLDQNLYQSVKGMSAAAQIVKQGGAIVIATECADGMPDHGRYKDLLLHHSGPAAFLRQLDKPGFSVHDQWQVQVQALIQRRARVFVKSAVLTDTELRQAWFEPVNDISEVVRKLMIEAGSGARLAVLPEGPQTIPYVRESHRAAGVTT